MAFQLMTVRSFVEALGHC